MFKTLCLFILFYLLQYNIAIASSSKGYPITTLLNAKWTRTPVHLEVAEFLHDGNPSHYWEFVESLAKLSPTIEQLNSDETQYKLALDLASKLIGFNQIGLLKLSLSLRSLTPLVQAHLQIAGEIKPEHCTEDVFVQIGYQVICDISKLGSTIHNQKGNDHNIELFEFDHIFPGSHNNSVTAILYGQIGTPLFNQYHGKLKDQAEKGVVRYVIRSYMQQLSAKRVRLSGYGVELYLKSTEYKSQDDSPTQAEEQIFSEDDETEVEVEGINFALLRQRYPHIALSLDRLRSDLSENHETIEPLKEYEFQDLGLQAAERIASIEGDEALLILQYTAQNFPIQARSLLHISVTDEFRSEMKNNINLFARNLNLQPPDAALFLNGMFFDADTLDINILLETLRSESKVLDGLFKIGIKGKSSAPLLALDLSSSSSKEFAIDIRDTAISWINDIENDAQYKRWSTSVLDLLRPTFPGMMRNVKKNLFNLVIIFDPITPDSRVLVKLAESFVLHSAPIRLGIVFNTKKSNDATEDVYRAIVCGFNYVSQQKSNSDALGFLTDIFADVNSNAEITIKDVHNQMKKKFNKLTKDQVDDILGEDSDFDYGRKLSNEFVERLGTREMPQVLLNGAPLTASSLNADEFEEAVLTEIMQQTPTIQKAVYRGELDDNMEVINYLMSQPHVMPRLNDRILSKDNIKYLDLSGTPHKDIEDVAALAQLSNIDMTATLLANVKHFGDQSNKQKFMGNQLHFLTIWVVGDLNTKSGKSLLANTMKFMKENKGVRVAFIPNADNQQPFKKDNANNLVWAILNTLADDDSIKLVSKLLDLDDLSTLVIPESVQGFLRETEQHLKLMRVYCQRVLGFGSSKNGVIVNGKMIGPLNTAETFEVEDYNLLEKFTNHLYIDKIKAALKESSNDQEQAELTSDSLLKLVSLLVPRQTTKTRYTLPEGLQQERTVVSLEAKQQDQPRFNIVAVVDPASRGAQKLAPILILLRNVVNCNIKLFLCAVEKHSDLPIKNFYRFVMESELQFLSDGKAIDGPIAKFVGLPSSSLLTQSLSAPENWLVEVVRSVHDLDNIKLANVNGPVHSEYELEYLLLEGHCFDTQSGAPPRGLQVTLGTKTSPILVDTIVMANLGYFQLKANPGAWTLQLRHGKSADIYDIASAEGPNTRHATNGTRVIISSLKSHVLKLRVTKKPGMQRADLLGEENEPSSGIWSSITNTITGGDSSVPETINIFSVASGHLYERLLRIMMLSLLKHTKSSVKFWFLKNYLSPQFIDVLPLMAKQYKFDYELVQYKWPRWLHQQTEKQRIIWGYKILFLDVLFPLDVKKIIFVDADQIVRADMKELHDLDLGGAPYGYTPFCDSRKEMDGFRFWKIGYWKNHLQGRKYHISALYVVDLKRFRKIAAGDRLRGQYQALSQDPNSLANLDQDLPNNMIHQVPMASLPQDWLWCETWCSSETLKTAKTIDLCNNPQTKEAKLDAAQRIVPEWKDYDNEIKQLIAKIEAEPEVRHSAEGNKGNNPEHIEL